jgi:hypothetical protein
MKPRHATALALVGWYLMVPIGDHGQYESKLAIPDWLNIGAYESKEDCSKALQTYFVNASRDSGLIIWHSHDERPAYDYVSKQALSKAQCIATDDPRLKPN